MGRSTEPISNRGYSNGDIASATNSVTDQFRFMHVSGNCDSAQVENLARNFMSTLGITNSNDEKYAEQLAALTSQVSQMMNRSEPRGREQNVPQNLRSSDGGLPSSWSSPQPSQKPATTKHSPKFQATNKNSRGRSPRRHQSRSKSPLCRVVDGMRSKSPFRKDRERTRSPMRQTSGGTSSMNTGSDIDGEEFFDTRMDSSYTVNSPTPKAVPKSTTASESKTERASSTLKTTSRPPLVSVIMTDVPSSNVNAPTASPAGQSTFKFDKEHDKFHIGSSPPKKFGSPGKKVRSPQHRSKTKTPYLATQGENHNDVSPLSDMGSVSGTTPFHPSTKSKPISTGEHPAAQNTENAAPFFSPVPEFHAPHAFVGNSGTRRIPSPHNIMQNDPSPEAASRRQTAPPGMASAAAAASQSLRNSASINPGTPPDQPQGATRVPNTADTAETFIKKKTRNTSTPPIVEAAAGATQQHNLFNVDLGSNANQAKGKGRRGNTLRKGLKKGSASFTTTRRTNGVFGLDEIKETGTDDTAPTTTESPSSGSAMSMDTSPIFSPPPTNFGAGISENPAQFNMGVGGSNIRTRSKRKENGARRAQFHRSQSEHVIHGPSRSSFDANHLLKHRSDILDLKEQGKKHYLAKNYRESTRVYSQAIQRYKVDLFAHVPSKDLLAVLLWNRAASLFMVGAYESSATDARIGIHYVTDPRNSNPALISPDANPVLRPKLYCRMGRSYLKLGKVEDANRAYEEAIQSATAIQDFHRRQNIIGHYDELEKIKTEATLERSEISRLSIILERISSLSKRNEAAEAISLIKKALVTANGSKDLHILKVKMLAESQRWREVTSHCERFAASNTKFDGCLNDDLSRLNPFPGVPVAKYLHADYFGDTKDDEMNGAELKLKNDAAPEAMLRLYKEMMPYYLRALRLEERYCNAEKCLSRLDKYLSDRAVVDGNKVYEDYKWLDDERMKHRETETNRGFADNLFANAKYEEAAKIYDVCLHLDSGESTCAGGRLHAILHCNRAACFMALKRFRDAMTECTAALKIYPRYLKAILRRARCYSRLDQTRQAENDFKLWLKIVEQSKKNGNTGFLGANIFHGPDTIKTREVEEIQAELNDMLKAKAREEEAKARDERARKMFRERSQRWDSERSDFTSGSNGSGRANFSRENFYSSSSRRWDSSRDQKSRSKPNGEKPKNSNKNQNRHNGRNFRDHKNFYSILGLTNRSTEEEVRKAYKKKALKCHPDKNPDDPNAAENFRRVKEAYETLNDPRLRRQYDAGR
ncbi:unnamed protein product [Pseudo-nitzschia multistriata]|uniref:J domain-containing protein n=1 Tax=Pseudo-nitzschia multistriata TaxID=183589 RepID=A0A448ZTE9_9STRA|nr:unnamed protein product [Pseudo-nitzschia multistriata]